VELLAAECSFPMPFFQKWQWTMQLIPLMVRDRLIDCHSLAMAHSSIEEISAI
jgi:hypothetical protein